MQMRYYACVADMSLLTNIAKKIVFKFMHFPQNMVCSEENVHLIFDCRSKLKIWSLNDQKLQPCKVGGVPYNVEPNTST
jgi:hypothetical protein